MPKLLGYFPPIPPLPPPPSEPFVALLPPPPPPAKYTLSSCKIYCPIVLSLGNPKLVLKS